MKPQTQNFGSNFWNCVLADDMATIVFIEAFAHLEFVGARWILAVPHTHWTAELHVHVNDEFNHFQILHEEAMTMHLNLPASSSHQSTKAMSLGKKATADYLNKLWLRTYKEIFKVASFRNEPHLLYSAVTLVIERRLMKIYPHIIALATQASLKETAKKIVEDEKNHLMLVKSLFHNFLPEEDTELTKKYFAIEESLAEIWLNELATIAQLSIEANAQMELDFA